jgi:hypothetical protein
MHLQQFIMSQDAIPDRVEQREVDPAIQALPVVFMVFLIDLYCADTFMFFVKNLVLVIVERFDVVEVAMAFMVCYFDSELFHINQG